MPALLVQSPTMGLNCLVASNMLDPKGAADGSYDVLYEQGFIKTPDGFGKLDMTTGLNSGDTILLIFQWKETDAYGHVMAVTTQKIYEHDRINSTWVDKTQAATTYNSALSHPVSFAVVGHDDTAIYLDDNAANAVAYYHVVVCDGGLSNIQRWAGRYEVDFADLVGAGGYHDGTQHRALQVCMADPNRLILLSPQTYSSSTKAWTEHNQQVRWPTIGKLQTWTGAGSGYYELNATGGKNVWSAGLGRDHVIYQDKSIWVLNYVGGTTVFSPIPVISNLGLLSYHLIAAYRDVHYFVGNDQNVYIYAGGTTVTPIGDPIHKYLKDDMNPEYNERCLMCFGAKNDYLWILIVPTGSEYITKGYCLNLETGAWLVRDFSSKFTSGGITSMTMAAAETYLTGDSYAAALDTLSSYDISNAGDATIRYGDKLLDTSRAITFDPTNASWCFGGLQFDGSVGCNYKADFTINDMLFVQDGSKFTNCRSGSHFYSVSDITSARAWLNQREASAAVGDDGAAKPAEVSFGLWDPTGETYRQATQEIEVPDRLLIADATGLVYQIDPSYRLYDSIAISCRHVTPEYDWLRPDIYKRWPGLSVVAEGTVGGAMKVKYRTGNFDTSDTGWADFTFDLTAEFREQAFFINRTSKRIQFAFEDWSGKQFDVREFKVLEPLVEENR